MRRFLSWLFILATISLAGCSSLTGDGCPYIIAGQKFEYEGSEGFRREPGCEFADVRFKFYNSSDKTVSKFTVSFMLYDSDGKNPFIGSNNVVENFDTTITPHSSKEIFVSLDDYLSIVPDSDYQMDFIYVSKIVYEDGSSWSDPFGMYASREAVE